MKNNEKFPAVIGEEYVYINDTNKEKFKLIRVLEHSYHFSNGHWCTDCVFFSMMKPLKSIQLSLTF